MSLPLAQACAHYKNGELRWEDYVHNVFPFVAGYPHEEDPWHEDYDELRKTDLFADSIWHWHKPITCINIG